MYGAGTIAFMVGAAFVESDHAGRQVFVVRQYFLRDHGDESAMLSARTLDGQPVRGTDSIRTVGCMSFMRPGLWSRDIDRLGTPRTNGPVNIERN